MKGAVLAACRSEPTRVQRRGWGTFVPFEKLENEGIVSDREVVAATLEGFAVRAGSLGAEGLFRLIDPLAATLSPAEADDALNIGLDLLEDLLKPEDGDGPWCEALEPPATMPAAIAGYLWAGLGSPVGWERWEFAHAVRGLVETDWSAVLGPLVDRVTRAMPGPFVDAGLVFYLWHARQWFTIGIARGALENPEAALVAAPLLRHLVGESHVVIRALAAQALAAMGGALPGDPGVDPAAVNRSALPETVYRGWSEPSEEMDGEADEPAPDDEEYYFGIDIGPYWFKPLGRVFGLSEVAIERRARAVLRQRMGWKGGGWRNDARHARKIFADRETHHSHGSAPKTDDLIAYHSYHAMMLVAADLLKTHSVRCEEGDARTDFEEWVSRYLLTREDGEWLADRRDPRLVSDPPAVEADQRNNWRWWVTKDYLDSLLRTDDGKIALWGHWHGGSDEQVETVSIRSAWATASAAESLVAFLQTADDFARFSLPSANREHEDDNTADGFRLEAWVEDWAIEPRLEEFDPWSERIRFPGCTPTAAFVAEMELVATTDGRLWRDAKGLAVRSEVWSRVNGYGREQETVAGWRLSADAEILNQMQEKRPDARLVVSVEVRRRAPQYGRDKDQFEEFPPPYARYFLMGADGVAQAL